MFQELPLKKIRLDQCVEVKSRNIVEEEESDEETNYAESMSENIEKNGRGSVVMNNFEGSFTLRSSFRSSSLNVFNVEPTSA